jgi:hypothetical protein
LHGSLSTFYPDAKLRLTLSDVKVTNASRLMGFFIHELRMNWSNIEKWRNLLKIGTIVLSSILKYCDKFKKNWSRNFKVITF